MCRTTNANATDVDELWMLLQTEVLSDEAKTEIRNRLAEFYYTDCRKLAGKLWSRNRLPPRLREDWESEGLMLMIHSVIPKYDGQTKFSTFLYFCMQRRLKQVLRTRFNRDSKRSVEIHEHSATVPPTDTTVAECVYQKLVSLVGEKVAHGRVFEGWSVEKMAEELGVSRATVYNWLQELRKEIA